MNEDNVKETNNENLTENDENNDKLTENNAEPTKDTEENTTTQSKTTEDLIRGKAANEFNAHDNTANVQIFMQTATFNKERKLRKISDFVSCDSIGSQKYDLTKEKECAKFFNSCKNKEYIALAIILSVFDIVSVGDLVDLKEKLVEYLPSISQVDDEGKEVEFLQDNPYLALNTILSVIGGNMFVTEDEQRCLGYGIDSEKIFNNIWMNLPSLRKSIVLWLLQINQTFEFKTTFEAYQIISAFTRIISADFADAERQIFVRLYSDPKNAGLLARLAQEILKIEKYKKRIINIALQWAKSDSVWLWKPAFLLYVYTDIPYMDNELLMCLSASIQEKLFLLKITDLKFISTFCSELEKARYLMSDILKNFDQHNNVLLCRQLVNIYMTLIVYGYYNVNKNLHNVPFIVCDSKGQMRCMDFILSYIMSYYNLRRQLYRILRVYLEEIANYSISQKIEKRIVAYFCNLAKNNYSYQRDILLFLEKCKGDVAKHIYRLLKEIYKN